MSKSRLWIAAAAFTTVSSPVAAQTTNPVPEACAGARDLRSFNSGHLLGVQLVQRAWGTVNDCARIDEFSDIVTANLDTYVLPSNPDKSVACRYSGVVAGVLDELGIVTGPGCDPCYADGQIAGEVSAIAYCQLSIALGGLATADSFLRGPVDVCGADFEVGCDAEFASTTQAYTIDAGSCLPYTIDPFGEVWDQARTNQCAYNPVTSDAADPNP